MHEVQRLHAIRDAQTKAFDGEWSLNCSCLSEEKDFVLYVDRDRCLIGGSDETELRDTRGTLIARVPIRAWAADRIGEHHYLLGTFTQIYAWQVGQKPTLLVGGEHMARATERPDNTRRLIARHHSLALMCSGPEQPINLFWGDFGTQFSRIETKPDLLVQRLSESNLVAPRPGRYSTRIGAMIIDVSYKKRDATSGPLMLRIFDSSSLEIRCEHLLSHNEPHHGLAVIADETRVMVVTYGSDNSVNEWYGYRKAILIQTPELLSERAQYQPQVFMVDSRYCLLACELGSLPVLVCRTDDRRLVRLVLNSYLGPIEEVAHRDHPAPLMIEQSTIGATVEVRDDRLAVFPWGLNTFELTTRRIVLEAIDLEEAVILITAGGKEYRKGPFELCVVRVVLGVVEVTATLGKDSKVGLYRGPDGQCAAIDTSNEYRVWLFDRTGELTGYHHMNSPFVYTWPVGYGTGTFSPLDQEESMDIQVEGAWPTFQLPTRPHLLLTVAGSNVLQCVNGLVAYRPLPFHPPLHDEQYRNSPRWHNASTNVYSYDSNSTQLVCIERDLQSPSSIRGHQAILTDTGELAKDSTVVSYERGKVIWHDASKERPLMSLEIASDGTFLFQSLGAYEGSPSYYTNGQMLSMVDARTFIAQSHKVTDGNAGSDMVRLVLARKTSGLAKKIAENRPAIGMRGDLLPPPGSGEH